MCVSMYGCMFVYGCGCQTVAKKKKFFFVSSLKCGTQAKENEMK